MEDGSQKNNSATAKKLEVSRLIPARSDPSDTSFESWLSPQALGTEVENESSAELSQFVPSLRPNHFSEYIGQKTIKENLLIACGATRTRNEPLDHLLLHGPPGLGKTSLARIVAGELGVGFKSTSGPVLERPGDLAAVLTSLEPLDVLFIDEIHRLSRPVEEVLYSAMEDYRIDIMIGQGPAARSIKLDLKPFTLVGATTRTGLLTSPLRDRFGLVMRLEYYSSTELMEIVLRSAKILNVEINEDAALEIGRRSRGTPRIANRLLKRVRDFAQQAINSKEVRNESSKHESRELLDLQQPAATVQFTVTRALADQALSRLEIDQYGLDRMDRAILQTIIEKFQGGPVGVEAVAASLGEESETLEEVYEPFLLQQGMITRGRRGREVTDLAYKHLNIPIRGAVNLRLF